MPIHLAEWGFIGLVRTISFNSHLRIDSLLSKLSHGWECEYARMAFELDTTLAVGSFFSSNITRSKFKVGPPCSEGLEVGAGRRLVLLDEPADLFEGVHLGVELGHLKHPEYHIQPEIVTLVEAVGPKPATTITG